MGEAYIVDAVRVAGGRKGGRLSGWHSADLAGFVLKALVARNGIDPDWIDDVILGCVAQFGEQGMNIGRSAVLAAGLPESVPGTTVDRQCGSSQQAVHFAAQAVMSGTMDIVIAGGVESMTRVPGIIIDQLEREGFGNYMSPEMKRRYPGVVFNQFVGAERIAKKYDLRKEELDAFAYESHRKAIAATEAGLFRDEIVPIPVTGPDGAQSMHHVDEGIRFDANLEAMGKVRRLSEEGVLTPASSSQICDGAAALVIANERGLKVLEKAPIARVHHMGVTGGDPVIMLETPIPATRQALERAGMALGDIDLFEINEAFAPIPLAWLRALDADPARLNVHGGAISLGHPLGGSGAKLMTTLVHALKSRGKRYGLQTMCEGGGLANVTIIERL